MATLKTPLSTSNQEGVSLYWETFWLEIWLGLPRFIVMSVISLAVVGTVAMCLFIPLWIFTLLAGGHFNFGLYFFCTFLASLFVGLRYAYINLKRSRDALKGSTQSDEKIAWALGAREPSRREEAKLQAVIDRLAEEGHENLNLHTDFWVIDSMSETAWTLGRSLFMTSAALKGKYAGAIYIREVAKLNNGDGLFLKALRSFVFPIIQEHLTTQEYLTRGSGKVNEPSIYLALAFGGLATMIKGQRWAAWFRGRDYLADQSAFELGFGAELKDYLENKQDVDIAVPFAQSWVQYTELRIDNLLRLEERERTAEAMRTRVEQGKAENQTGNFGYIETDLVQ